MKIFLFDMDGVLLIPGGYHRALQDTVGWLAEQLGFTGVGLEPRQIHAFEAAGVTNEWDSAAICYAALADRVCDLAPESLSVWARSAPELPQHGRTAPDFSGLVEAFGLDGPGALRPARRAKRILPARVHGIIDLANSPEGLSHRIQQEHVLGSEAYANAYRRPAQLDVPSYLVAYDRPTLAAGDLLRLKSWRQTGRQAAAVFTNRPSLPPEGLFGTPEGELGAEAAGVADLPLAGTGGVTWLEQEYAQPPGVLNKPHPAHALAAMRMALGEPLESAFKAAGRLALEGRRSGGWEMLEGAEVWVFEDAVGGLESLRIAVELLAEAGVRVLPRPVGVADAPIKRQALERAGASVYRTLAEALDQALGD